MEFIGLKIALFAAISGVVYYLYRKYRADLTADALMADVKKAVAALEVWAANEAKTIEAAAAAKAKQEAAIISQQSSVQQVTDFVNKVKTAIGA